MYDIEQNNWILICADTNTMGGPKLLFDHQMVMDSISSTIYVFGGRVVASSSRFKLNLFFTFKSYFFYLYLTDKF